VRDTHTYTNSYSYFNSATYAHAQRQSNTKGSPDAASEAMSTGTGEWLRRVIG
jgi:hypothetical protein